MRVSPYILLILVVVGCSKVPDSDPIDYADAQRWVVLNEGTFQFGNASLSVIYPDSSTVENEAFQMANNMPLGDVAQSFVQYGDTLLVVVNNSGMVLALEANNFTLLGAISGLTSPRYLEVYDNKALLTHLWGGGLDVIDLSSFQVEKHMDLSGWSEHMLTIGQDVWITRPCADVLYAYNTVDQSLDSLVIGGVSRGLVAYNGQVLSLNQLSDESLEIVQIDPESRAVTGSYSMGMTGWGGSFQALNDGRFTFHNNHVWVVDANNWTPDTLILQPGGANFYQVSALIDTQMLAVSDATDFVSAGRVFTYDFDGTPIDTFSVGIGPSRVRALR